MRSGISPSVNYAGDQTLQSMHQCTTILVFCPQEVAAGAQTITARLDSTQLDIPTAREVTKSGAWSNHD